MKFLRQLAEGLFDDIKGERLPTQKRQYSYNYTKRLNEHNTFTELQINCLTRLESLGRNTTLRWV
jgi:hypothetical protein